MNIFTRLPALPCATPTLATLAATGALLLAIPTASAGGRHYTYTYETGVLPAGATEIESWTTIRLGREEYYARFDHRLEFEVGLIDDLQLAVYTNFHTVAAGEPAVTKVSLDGISLELKGKLLDPVADPLGLGLYFEVAGGPMELELEGKVLLEKRFGDFGLAVNLVYEGEFKRGVDSLDFVEQKTEVDLAFGWFASPEWSLGLELVSRTKFEKEDGAFELESSALFLGPTVSYNTTGYFVAATFLPQLAALAGASDGSALALDGRERYEVRLLVGLDL